MTGTDMTHVPYKGQRAGDHRSSRRHARSVDFDHAGRAGCAHISGGKIKVLAVSTGQRAKALPNVVTIEEGGVKGYATGLWTGLLAPAGTPPQIIARLNAAVNEALVGRGSESIARHKQGAEPDGTPEKFAAEIKRRADAVDRCREEDRHQDRLTLDPFARAGNRNLAEELDPRFRGDERRKQVLNLEWIRPERHARRFGHGARGSHHRQPMPLGENKNPRTTL